MKTIPPCQSQLKMLVLDFDGTTADYSGRVRIHQEVLRVIDILIEHGMFWVIASDRSMIDLERITEHLDLQQRPIALLTQQRYIHLKDDKGEYNSHDAWNVKMSRLHRELWLEISPCFDYWTSIVKDYIETLVSIQDEESYGFVVAEGNLQTLDHLLKQLLQKFPSAKVIGNHNSRIVLHKSFSKGIIVNEVCRTLCVNKENVFTIGDGINDLTMMTESVCGGVGCPADACMEVIEQVRSRGGVIGEAKGPEGTAEVLMQLSKDGSSGSAHIQ